MHGAVEHHGGGRSVQPKGADEGGGLPVPMGDRRPAPIARPERRAILVDAPVSSTKTSLSGSRSGWVSNQAPRRCSTSGRCCLLACADFFKGDAAAEEEAPHRALGDPQPMLALQMGRDLRQHHVRSLFDQRQDHLGPCLDPLRAPVATLWPGPIAACSLPGPNALDRRRRRDPEALGRSPRRGPGRGHCTLEYPITVCCLGRPYARLEPEQEDRRRTLPESLQAEDASTLPATGAFDEAATGLALLFGRDSARLDLDSACSS